MGQSNLARGLPDRHVSLKALVDAQSDPRNPQRPAGEAGASWVTCRNCGRGAPTIRLLRHTKHCAPGAVPLSNAYS